MNDEAEQTPDDDVATVSPSAGSRKLPAWLTGIATVLVIASIFSTWVEVQALDTDRWVSLSDELLQDEEIQEALADFVVDTLYEELDLAGAIEDGLPENLEGLAGPLSAAFRGPATTAVDGILTSERFRTAWLEANRVAHQALINILRDDTGPALSATDGAVVLELGELIKIVGEKLGLPDSLLDRLPEDAGQVTIIESDALADVQAAVRVLEFMSWFTLVVVVALYASAVYLAVGRRRRTLRNVGLSLLGGGVVALVLSALTTRLAIDAVVENPARESVARATARIGTGLVREMSSSAIIYGLLIAAFASLLGDHRWARAARRFIAPALTASTGAIVAGVAGLLLVLIWWSPGRAFERWVSAVLLFALVIGAVVALRRLVVSEHPPTRAEHAPS